MFQLCTKLLSVTIGNSVTSIGGNAFNGCNKLTSVTIPDSVTSIGNNAFKGCNLLITVVIEKPSNIFFVNVNSFTNVNTAIGSSITFNNTSSINDLSEEWKSISGYYATSDFFPQTFPPTVYFHNINVTYGNVPVQISYNSNSTGEVTFTSSDTLVATVLGNIITFLGNGNSTITAFQAASGNYTEATTTMTCTVAANTPINPLEVTSGIEVEYALNNTTAENIKILNNIIISSALVASGGSVSLSSAESVTITMV